MGHRLSRLSTADFGPWKTSVDTPVADSTN